MQPDLWKFLFDAREACDAVLRFTVEKSYDDYGRDELLRNAVERKLIIVGEELFQAGKLQSDLASTITSLRRIVGFRHVMVHHYGIVEDATVWGIVRMHVPTLRTELDGLLASAADAPRT